MALLEEEELKRLRAKQLMSYDPNVRSIVDKEDEKLNVLYDKRMPAEKKIARIQYLDSHKENARRDLGLSPGSVSANRRPPVPEVNHPPVQLKQEPEEEKVSQMEQAFAALPAKKSHKEAARVASILVDTDILKANDEGEIMYHGKRIPNSDIKNLVRYLYYASSSVAEPVGLNEFLRGLKQIGVSADDVSSPYAKSGIRSITSAQPSATSSSSRASRLAKTPKKEQSASGKSHLLNSLKSPIFRFIYHHNRSKQKPRKRPPGKRPNVLYVYWMINKITDPVFIGCNHIGAHNIEK